MMKIRFERLSVAAAVGIAVLGVAACTIRLRGDERETRSSAPLTQSSDPLAARTEHCRTVKYEEKDALVECRKIWAERRRRFLGETSRAPVDRNPNAATRPGSPASVMPGNDQSRLPSGYPSTPAQGE